MKILYGIIAATVVIAGLVLVINLKPLNESPAAEQPKANSPDTSQNVETAQGRYIEYANDAQFNQAGYTTTILFFHAPWCPECRAFEKAILSEDIPEGVQILKTDYDTSENLRSKYGVTLQTTFVKVDTAGNKQSLWVGYEQDKSVEAILNNL